MREYVREAFAGQRNALQAGRPQCPGGEGWMGGRLREGQGPRGREGGGVTPHPPAYLKRIAHVASTWRLC